MTSAVAVARDICVSSGDEGIHPVAVQPKKAPCELPKIVPIGTTGSRRAGASAACFSNGEGSRVIRPSWKTRALVGHLPRSIKQFCEFAHIRAHHRN